MSWLKIGIPLLVGAAALALNYMSLNSKKTAPQAFIRVNDRIEAGTAIEKEMLEKVEISGSPEELQELSRTAIPYTAEGLGMIVGRPLIRNLSKNDMVLLRDLTTQRGEITESGVQVSLEGIDLHPKLLFVGNEISFFLEPPLPEPTGGGTTPAAPPAKLIEIGPFRILSIDEIADPQVSFAKELSVSAAPVITVARKKEKGGKDDHEHLVQLIRAKPKGDKSGNHARIVALILHPRAKTTAK